jgi:bacteriorhodopsin
MRAAPPLSAKVFAILGALLLVAAVALAALGSFAFFAIASVGMFFIAAALIAQTVSSPEGRAPAVLALGAVALIVFGVVATPFYYAGWGLLAGAAALAFINALDRARRNR